VLLEDADGLLTYRFESLAVDGLAHAVFTRRGGVSEAPFATLNVGRTVGDDPDAVAENHARIYAHLDLKPNQVVTPSQVHGNHVAVIKDKKTPELIPNTDGLVTATPDTALLLRFADCQPILFYDPIHRALGLVHAGWRGIAQGIARRAVERMEEAFGSEPGTLVVGLGPAIGPCCYTVGDTVASAMSYALSNWREVMSQEQDHWRFNLPGANAQQLTDAGVRHIEQSNVCTACQVDHFYSHRAEQGRTGRFAVVAYLRDGSSFYRPGRESAPRSEGIRDGDEGNGSTGTGTPIPSLHPPGLPTF
jgi:YfiH family protein